MVCLYECVFWFVAIVQPSLNPLMSQMFSFLPLKKYTAVLSSGCLSCHRQSALSLRAQVNLSAVCCWFAFIFDADFTRSPSLLSRLGWLLHVYFISVSLFTAGIKFIANCALILPGRGILISLILVSTSWPNWSYRSCTYLPALSFSVLEWRGVVGIGAVY